MCLIRRLALPCLLLLALLPYGRAHAAEPSHKDALARRLMELTHADDLIRQLEPQAINPLLASLKQMNPGREQEIQTLAESDLLPAITKSTAALMPRLVAIYASHYSEDDLRAIIAFYQTPAGQRLIASLPAITQESAAAGQEWGKQTLVSVFQGFVESCRAKGLTVGK